MAKELYCTVCSEAFAAPDNVACNSVIHMGKGAHFYPNPDLSHMFEVYKCPKFHEYTWHEGVLICKQCTKSL